MRYKNKEAFLDNNICGAKLHPVSKYRVRRNLILIEHEVISNKPNFGFEYPAELVQPPSGMAVNLKHDLW
jgi:hypothetical protein